MRILIFCSLLLLPGFANATLIVDDAFNDAGISNGADPLDISWSVNGGGGTLAVADDTAGIGTGNAAIRTPTGNFGGLRGTLASSTLLDNVGDTLTLSFDFRLAAAPVANGSGFRFGVGNAGNAFALAIGTGGTTAGSLFYNPNGATGGAGQIPFAGQAGATFTVNDQLPHAATLTLVRTATGFDAAAEIAGMGIRTGNIPSSTTGFFENIDRIYLGNGGVNVPYHIDNVQLDYTAAIPEPNSAVLSLLGALLVIRRRRS